jgi:hypothetical protein
MSLVKGIMCVILPEDRYRGTCVPAMARGSVLFVVSRGAAVFAYLLMLAALILVGGSLGDKLGRKKIFMIGIALFMLASLACGLSPTIAIMLGARVLQGIGGALMIPSKLSFALIKSDYVIIPKCHETLRVLLHIICRNLNYSAGLREFWLYLWSL